MRLAGKYRRLAAIGHGGMADVHLAAARGPGDSQRLVVLKELRPGLAQDPEMRAMFQQEARVAGRMVHPNIVRTHEIGSEAPGEGRAPRPFIAMEFLDGQPLQRVLRRMRRDTGSGLPLPLHVHVLLELLAGLHHAHELCDHDGRPLGLVHRDVTPHNVIVTHDGEVKLIDFGIVRCVEGGAETQVGTFKGKASYCAPEQARGEAVDRRADLFAVGVMLWEALTQRRMWPELDEVAIVSRLRAGEVPALPDGPHAGLRAVCRRALAPDPGARPPTAAALAEAIEQHAPEPRGSRGWLAEVMCERFAAERADLRAIVEVQMRRPRERDPDAPVVDMALLTETDSLILGGLPRPAVDEPTRPDGLAARPRVTVPHVEADARERDEATESSPSRPVVRPRRRLVAAAVLAGGLAAAGLGARAYVQGGAPGSRTPAGHDCDSADKPEVELSGEIEGDARLTCDRRYRLSFVTFVRPGATLTIEPGTTIVGDLATRGTLVVQPGARLIAEGTPERPIVFTSAAPAGQRAAGDWGGLLLLGRAPSNLQDAHGRAIRGRVEGLADGGEYGGDDPTDSSGVLSHVRVEYSGLALGPNNEINGLTLAAVGRGTRIDHVQVRHTTDDCFELFGGTVDAKYLLCQNPGDDGVDWDLGYTGRLQFVLVRGGGGHGLEGDNDPAGSGRAPVSAPQIYNATLCGAQGSTQRGLLVRHGGRATVGNVIFSGYAQALELRGEAALVGALGVETAAIDGPGCRDEAGSGPAAALTDGAVAPPDDGFFDASARHYGALRDPGDGWTRAAWTRWD